MTLKFAMMYESRIWESLKIYGQASIIKLYYFFCMHNAPKFGFH